MTVYPHLLRPISEQAQHGTLLPPGAGSPHQCLTPG